MKWSRRKEYGLADSDKFVDEVKVDLHVLHALVLHGIGGEVDHADIVAVDEGGTREGALELLKYLTESGRLCHVICHSAILGLSVGTRDNGLPLQGPGDDVDHTAILDRCCTDCVV